VSWQWKLKLKIKRKAKVWENGISIRETWDLILGELFVKLGNKVISLL